MVSTALQNSPGADTSFRYAIAVSIRDAVAPGFIAKPSIVLITPNNLAYDHGMNTCAGKAPAVCACVR